MPLTVDTIRNFAGGDGILLNSQGGLDTVGKGQRFRSFFNIGDARQRNAETLTAIHHAIINDPRYFSVDVQAEAARLLSQVRTDRAVGTAEIKSIIDRLDKLSTDALRRSSAMEIVSGRVAARGFPAFLPASGGQGYLKLAREHIVPRNEPQGGFGRFDYDAALDAFDAVMGGLFARIGDVAGDKDVLGDICGQAFRLFSGGLMGQADLDGVVDALKANLDESRALGALYGDQTRREVVDMIKMMGKPIAPTATVPNPMRALVDVGRSVQFDRIAALSANSSAQEINDAIHGFVSALTALPNGLSFSDNNEVISVQTLMAHCAVNSMPDDVKERFLAALESDTGKNLLAFYASEYSSREASNMTSFVTIAVAQIKKALGKPDPERPIPVPRAPDVSKLTPRLLSQFSFSGTVTGNGPGRVRTFAENIDLNGATGTARTKMADSCLAMVVTNISQQIGDGLCDVELGEDGKVSSRTFNPDKIDTQFDLDLRRGSTVRLPGGQELPKDPAAARDELVRFLTGDGSATFKDADTPTKVKVHILSSCMNQAMSGIALSAYGECLSGDAAGGYARFLTATNDKLDRQEVYELSRDANGDVKLHFVSHRPVKVLVVDGNATPIGQGSYDEFEMDVSFPAANLDALSRADWSKYDHNPVRAADRSHADLNRHRTAADLVPDQYMFKGTVAMYPHIHIEKA